MEKSFSLDFSDTSTQIERKKPDLSKIITSHFLSSCPKDPREESFFEMLQINIFPLFSFLSFTSFLMFIIVAFFIVQLIFGGIIKDEQFLNPGSSILTTILSANHQNTVIRKQLYQLFTCQFIHPSAIALLSNLFLLIFAVSWVEAMLGTWRTITAFILNVICTNAVVILYLQPSQSIIGTNSGIFGLFGSALGCLILNWPNLNFFKFPRILVFWMFSLLIGFSMIYAKDEQTVVCQLIGVMVGVLVGMFCSPTSRISQQQRKELNVYQIMMFIFGLLSYLLTLIIYTCLILLS